MVRWEASYALAGYYRLGAQDPERRRLVNSTPVAVRSWTATSSTTAPTLTGRLGPTPPRGDAEASV
jgi:hypothetical protein